MKTLLSRWPRLRGGFSLIELLVVIAIMGLLAAMVLAIAGTVNRKKTIALAQADLGQLETAIEAYKAKMGFYPPGNSKTDFEGPARPSAATNQLFYELTGTTTDGTGRWFTNVLGEVVTTTAIQNSFGSGVTGFMNSSRDPGEVQKFLRTWRPNQIGLLNISGVPIRFFAMPVSGPMTFNDAAGQWVTPWSYDPSSTNRINSESYDLWIDITLGGKTNRICNWSQQPVLL